MRDPRIEHGERRPVGQRVKRSGEECGDADDQQPVRAALPDRLPRQVPKNATVSTADVTLVTSGQLVMPRNGGYGGRRDSGFVVRGSPCRPLCMFTNATTANTTNARRGIPQPSRAASGIDRARRRASDHRRR